MLPLWGEENARNECHHCTGTLGTGGWFLLVSEVGRGVAGSLSAPPDEEF